MGKQANQSEGRRDNAAVPAWEITKGAGTDAATKPAKPDQSTSNKPAPR